MEAESRSRRSLVQHIAIAAFALGVLSPSDAAADVNKCQMPDGRIVYSDAPCPQTTKQADKIVKSPGTATRPPPPMSTGRAPSKQLEKPETVQFSGNASSDIIKASALMDNIKILGRDCEWALKVDDSKIQKCRDFLGKLQPSGEYEQIAKHVQELIKDQRVLADNASELRRMTRHVQDIARYKEFTLANLKSR